MLGGRVVRTTGYPILDLQGDSWPEFLARQSTRFRKSVRFGRNRLERHAAVEYRYAAPRPLEGDLDAAFRLHRARFGDHTGCLFCGEHEAFQREFAAIALERGWLRLLLLEVDGRAVGLRYGFFFQDAYFAYQGGRDPAWDRESVGFLLEVESIRRTLEEGGTEYRFLGGEEDYKYRYPAPGSPPGDGRRAGIASWAGRFGCAECRLAPTGRPARPSPRGREGMSRTGLETVAAGKRLERAARRAPKTARSLRLGSQSARQANGLRRRKTISPVQPPARNAALAAAAAPEAPNRGIRTRSRPIPTTSDTSGPTEDNPGAECATRALEKTIIAVKPSAPGRSHRNGVTDASNASPKTSGSSTGPMSAATSAAAAVTSAAERKARRACSTRSPTSVRAAAGRSAVAIAAGRYRSTSDALTATA